MTNQRAWFVDVWETLISIDFSAMMRALADEAAVSPDQLWGAASAFSDAVTVGRMSGSDAFFEAALQCGATADNNLRQVIEDTSTSFLRSHADIYPDTVSFMKRARASGDLVTLFSNCGDNTRPLLEALGLFDYVDDAFLSCEIGVGKPDRGIFEHAVGKLSIESSQATLIDDQVGFCEGALAAGVGAIHLVRDHHQPERTNPAIRVVNSLDEL